MYNHSLRCNDTSQYAHTYVYHTHLYNSRVPSCYLCTAVLNDCKSEVMPYIAHY